MKCGGDKDPALIALRLHQLGGENSVLKRVARTVLQSQPGRRDLESLEEPAGMFGFGPLAADLRESRRFLQKR